MLTQIMHVNFSSMTAPHLVSVVQGDTGRNLKCIVDDFTLDGAWTATWYVERPSDIPVYNTATIETSDNSVNLELTAQSINEVGDNKLQVRILDADDQVVTSFACILSVKPFGGIDAVESTTESNIFDQQVEEAKQKIDTALDEHLENGIFPTMTAGGLVGDTYAENKTPYFFRPSGGGAEVGKIESPVLVGGSVGWNQRVKNGNFADTSEWSTTYAQVTISGNTATVTASAQYGRIGQNYANQTIANHKYIVSAYVYGNTSIYVDSGDFGYKQLTKTNQWEHIAFIGTRVDNHWSRISVGDRSASDWAEFKVRNAMCIDLTVLLGSTVADRLYTMEQSTSGSGVAQLQAWGFDFSLYVPYTAPTLRHVEGVSAHVMRDAEDNIIGNYPLDASLTLRGVPKLDANNSLYYDGDTYEHDGTVTRKYGVVDLGTLTWSQLTTNVSGKYRFATSGIATVVKKPSSLSQVANIVCAKYVTISGDKPVTNVEGVAIHTNGNILIYDEAHSADEASAFKTAMSGVYLVYELATATTETASPFAEYQEVDANGTEEYVSTGVVPVGHVTKYPTDLKGTFETILSEIPSANGTYALKVTVANGKHTFSWV